MRPAHSRPASHWRMTWGRGVAVAAMSCVLLAASVVAADDDAPVIPPGQEALIAGMLARGMVLDHCTLITGGVEYTTIKATYNCAFGEVSLELDHPRNAAATSTRTGQFAITVRSGSPPPGFENALASLVRSQEGAFQWAWPERDAAAEDDDAAE